MGFLGGFIMSIGANIRKRRYELKMSQQELADAMGYKTRSTISKIESGENDVSQKKLQKIASLLDTTVEYLISNFEGPVYNSNIRIQTSTNKNIVLILAGGKSSRNYQNIPNQFINIHGKPVIVYCMEAYQKHPSIDDIYIVCLKGWENIVEAYAEQYHINKLKGLIPAGTSGITSIKNGIDFIKDLYSLEDNLIIQESTRPMVTVDLISKLLQACNEKKSATVCQYMRDYVQFSIKKEEVSYLDRNTIVDLQSPEAHKIFLILDVFEKAIKIQHVLDESCCTMLLYNMGQKINFIEGIVNNIKIVRQEDIILAKAMLTRD